MVAQNILTNSRGRPVGRLLPARRVADDGRDWVIQTENTYSPLKGDRYPAPPDRSRDCGAGGLEWVARPLS